MANIKKPLLLSEMNKCEANINDAVSFASSVASLIEDLFDDEELDDKASNCLLDLTTALDNFRELMAVVRPRLIKYKTAKK